MISHGPIGQLVSSAFNVAERPHCTTIDNCLVPGPNQELKPNPIKHGPRRRCGLHGLLR